MRATVSTHAITRYRERVAAVPFDIAERVIAGTVQRAVSAAVGRAVDVGEWEIHAGNVTFVLIGPHVVTVKTGESRAQARTRHHCRRQIAFSDGERA